MAGDEKRPLGKILLQRKLVSQQELDAALRAQKKNPTPAPLASQLIDDGTVKEVDALRALSEQSGVPGIDLTQIVILLEHLDMVPRQLAETHRVLPVLVRSDRIFLATEDPHEKRVVDELEFVTGKKVYSYIAVHSTLVRAIAAAYDARARGDTYYLGPQVPEEKLRQLGLQSPAVIIEEAVETASRDSEVSTSEFGAIGDEVSSVSKLPDELRIRATQATAAMTGGTGKLILVVDDEEDIRKLLNRLLTQKGYRVIEADRGLLALRLVKDHVPDLIILDAMLPELHGFDIARRIKGSAKYGRIPIIMVSAVYRGWRIAADLKQNYGVEEYVEKPFRIGALLEVVTRLLPAGDSGPISQSRDPEYLSSEAESALREGIAAYKDGLIEEAIEHLKRGVGIDPLSYRLHFHLALLFGKKGQIYEGIQELEKAIDLHPQHFAALKNLAVLYEKAGFKNRAVEMWERCAALAPDEPTRESVKQHLRRLI
jgi:DNA-binding response OmpR family regulator